MFVIGRAAGDRSGFVEATGIYEFVDPLLYGQPAAVVLTLDLVGPPTATATGSTSRVRQRTLLPPGLRAQAGCAGGRPAARRAERKTPMNISSMAMKK